MKFVIPAFSGMAPRLADSLLKEVQGSFVTNLKLTSGELKGYGSNEHVHTLDPPGTYRRVKRLFYPGTDINVWWKSTDVNAVALMSPLAADAFNRVYITDANYAEPRITTLDAIAANATPSVLGVARPTVPPGVTAVGGASPIVDVRAYVYLWVTPYGEEGPPSPPTVVVGKPDSTWTITVPTTVPTNVIYVDIYRSATGDETTGNYFKVARRNLGDPASFVDTMPENVLPLQKEIDSTNNDPPPAGLQGLVQHSSGAFAAFNGRAVYFSRPYLPHAWPQTYKYIMASEVVGISAISNSIVAMTQGSAQALTGNTPDAIAMSTLAGAEPCLSQRSIVVYDNTVFYASPNGIASVGGDGPGRPTNELVTREEWYAYQPDDFCAAMFGRAYISFFEATQGLAIFLPPYEPVSLVQLDRYSGVTGLDTDERTGDLMIIEGSDVSWFDAIYDTRFQVTFRSKEFIAPMPINLGAYQVISRPIDDAVALAAMLETMADYNVERIAAGPLDTLGLYALNGSRVIAPPIPKPPNIPPPPIQPFGGDPLYNIDFYAQGGSIRFTLIADGEIRYTNLVTNQRTHKLPSGYKATRFYVELSGSAVVQRVIVAETARECREA